MNSNSADPAQRGPHDVPTLDVSRNDKPHNVVTHDVVTQDFATQDYGQRNAESQNSESRNAESQHGESLHGESTSAATQSPATQDFAPGNDSTQNSATQQFEPQNVPTLDAPGMPGAARAGATPAARRDADSLHVTIGRYRVERVLGEGGFGRVYLAYDEQLDRRVAIKVPRPERVNGASEAESFLAEARNLARLDHPNIVPVHDVGRLEDGLCYVVSKYIEGRDLAAALRDKRFSIAQSVNLIALVAEALHHAHRNGLVHRDIKPGNILLDEAGRPVVVDFGLALREEDLGRGAGLLGTPAYMSPEQARGEGHRVDGRSDIFSLGVVLYEMLSGRRPFRGEKPMDLLDQVANADPPPLRELAPTLPQELERICDKALAKRASERYATAAELADDLRSFLARDWTDDGRGDGAAHSVSPDDSRLTPSGRDGETSVGGGTLSWRHRSTPTASDRRGVGEEFGPRVVPKGLRSFDAHDANFFLELLPGPRDRDGLPDTLRFWKTRIEQTNPDETFAIGLLYGPSGCGKSSLVKAGLLPRLSADVTPLYIEATAAETNTRLLHGLRRRIPALGAETSLKHAISALRRGQGVAVGRKVLIVIDQFEQWLYGASSTERAELVAALRQCDGGHVQCLILVRDDFWLAVSRFARELEVRLVEGRNVALVDLFDTEHALRVLAAFGQAFGRLPADMSAATDEQREFLDQCVAGLAQDGKVVCVRLALFAEMMKDKPWTPASLRAVGGTHGVGVTFLEETFSAASASPAHRTHERAARAVLEALLPEPGADIKGRMKSHDELLAASAYAKRPSDFEDLLGILNGELRLVTPTAPEGQDDAGATSAKHYQLSHDYLVHSLREWVTQKQRESRRGRAELRLAERTATWNARPENRQLPTAWEFLTISTLTARRRWTTSQATMMSRAARVHGARGAALLVAICAAAYAARYIDGRYHASAAVEQLESVEVEHLDLALEHVQQYRRWAEADLRARVAAPARSADARRLKLHARLALLPIDSEQIGPLRDELLNVETSYDYAAVIRRHLATAGSQLEGGLWELLVDKSVDPIRRFHAAVALAGFAPDSERWSPEIVSFVCDQMVSSNAERQPQLRNLLRPLRMRMIDDLERIFSDSRKSEHEQTAAASGLAEFASDQPLRLAKLLVIASPTQYAALHPEVAASSDPAVKEFLAKLAAEQPAESLDKPQRIELGRRRAGSAITLLRAGDKTTALEALRSTADHEAQSQFVERSRRRGVSPADLIACVDELDQARQKLTGPERRRDDVAMQSLLSALGEFALDELPTTERQPLTDRLLDWYRNDPSAAVHGMTGWLLRRWGFARETQAVDDTPIAYDTTGRRDWYTLKIDAKNKRGDGSTPLHFTFVVVPKGRHRVTRSSATKADPEWVDIELTRPVAVCDRELTWRQWNVFDGGDMRTAWARQFKRELTDVDPAFGVCWYDVIDYCRWLTVQAGGTEAWQCYEDPAKSPRDADGKPKHSLVALHHPGFRMPTSAEWEVACRGGSTTDYPYGNDPRLLGAYAWYQGTANDWSHPVATLRPTHNGLFDMIGNLSEWTQDRSGAMTGIPRNVDPLASGAGKFRTARGGNLSGAASRCRAQNDYADDPAYRVYYLGFRLAICPEPNAPSLD